MSRSAREVLFVYFQGVKKSLFVLSLVFIDDIRLVCYIAYSLIGNHTLCTSINR